MYCSVCCFIIKTYELKILDLLLFSFGTFRRFLPGIIKSLHSFLAYWYFALEINLTRCLCACVIGECPPTKPPTKSINLTFPCLLMPSHTNPQNQLTAAHTGIKKNKLMVEVAHDLVLPHSYHYMFRIRHELPQANYHKIFKLQIATSCSCTHGLKDIVNYIHKWIRATCCKFNRLFPHSDLKTT